MFLQHVLTKCSYKMFLLLFLTFASCTDTQIPQPQTTSNTNVTNSVNNVGNPFLNYGVSHNDGLNYYHDNYFDTNYVNFYYQGNMYHTQTAYKNSITSAREFFLSKGYTNTEITIEINKMNNIFTTAGVFDTLNGNPVLNDLYYKLDDLLYASLNLGYTDSITVSTLIPLLNQAYTSNNLTKGSVDIFFNQFSNSSTNYTLLKSKAIWEYSYLYWNSEPHIYPPYTPAGIKKRNHFRDFIERNKKEIVDVVAFTINPTIVGTIIAIVASDMMTW